MTSQEKYNKMLSLEPYNDRTEIPVLPHMIASMGPPAGMTQTEIMASADNWLKAVDKTLSIIGHPDACMPLCPDDTAFFMGLPLRKPGRELGDNELYQFVEKPYFDDPAEYEKILQMGWANWYVVYMMSIQNPPMTTPEEFGARYQVFGANAQKTFTYFYSHGIVPAIDTATYPIFDNLSLIRSMEEFTIDLYDDPGPIMDIIHKFQAEEDEKTIQMLKASGGTRCGIYPMRSSASFLSPDMFEEYVWDELKASILRFWNAGIVSVIHADSDWLPMLEHFAELPKGCCHIELDGATDIFRAYEILQGRQSIRGDVPANMFAYGTEDDVRQYCEKLIEMGMKGGFMLSSGCEIPLNAKVENIKAMMDAVKCPAERPILTVC